MIITFTYLLAAAAASFADLIESLAKAEIAKSSNWELDLYVCKYTQVPPPGILPP